MCYDYNRLKNEIELLTKNYDIIEAFSIGQSVMDKNIPCLKLGFGKKKLFLSAAYHGLEYLTSAFLMKFLTKAAEEADNEPLNRLLQKVTIYAVPMVNPDGVDIAIHGLDITNPHHRRLISMVGIHSFNTVWQANARGVDINHNFDANWQMITDYPLPSKYGGEYAESEPETRAITEFARKEKFDMLIAFHSQGREIYYDFDGMESKRSEEIAEKLAEESGYAVCRPTGTAAFGGCKDWFIKEFGKEGFTVEIGSGENPLPMSDLDNIYEENKKLILRAMEEI